MNVKFAVKNLDIDDGKGELIQYPGSNVDEGLIFVQPKELAKDQYATMTNLNGQGCDLRVSKNDSSIRLFGDGDGYQFTDLVLVHLDELDFDSESNGVAEGYVWDYGATYGDLETFKQFITCKWSKKQL